LKHPKPMHPSSSRAFQTHQEEHDLKHPKPMHPSSSRAFQRHQEEHDSKHPKPMHPSLSRAFQRHQEEHDLKHPGLVDLIITKQTTFLHRYRSIFLIFLLIWWLSEAWEEPVQISYHLLN
jgi:hypothetical protein